MAAFANGALAHAFEMDNLTWPNTGVHPGATMLAPALAVAQERGIGGRELLAAFVAGAEVMIRIGRATKHNNEGRGFHAPGTTGPFGGAIAVGRLMKFDAGKMTNALGIAGSLACGLLEFARSGTGAMVKRLHLGRAAESGVLAASLAADGFTGPASVLGRAVRLSQRVLRRRSRRRGADARPRQRVRDLAHHAEALPGAHHVAHFGAGDRGFAREHGYAGDDVASIQIAGNPKMATINNIPAPTDLMMAQYSLPFCVALAHYRDPRDPRSFNAATFNDPAIRSLARRVTITVSDEAKHGHTLASTVTVTLKNGRVLTRASTTSRARRNSPLDRAEMREKFLLLTRHCDRNAPWSGCSSAFSTSRTSARSTG